VIRIDAMWLCAEPLDMRAGAGRLRHEACVGLGIVAVGTTASATADGLFGDSVHVSTRS